MHLLDALAEVDLGRMHREGTYRIRSLMPSTDVAGPVKKKAVTETMPSNAFERPRGDSSTIVDKGTPQESMEPTWKGALWFLVMHSTALTRRQDYWDS
jgi:hypothetical protein